MNISYWVKIYLTTTLCFLCDHIHAQTYAALAYGKDYVWPATAKTEWEAEQKAMDKCHEDDIDCELVGYTSGFVEVVNEDGFVFLNVGKQPLSELLRLALKKCANVNCKIRDIINKPGFFSLAEFFENGTALNHFFYYGTKNSDLADELALKKCNEKMNVENGCEITYYGVIKGNIDALYDPYITPSPANEVTQARASCRPTTNPIRCTSNCVNGNCKVTYENGCILHVTVQAKYDAFKNQWAYPAPQC